MTETALRRARLTAQLLAGRRARSAEAVAGRLLAVQAQNLRAARLAVRARSAGLTAAGVNAALERREVVISWLGRGTLHMALPDDYPWLLGLTAPTQETGNLRRLHQLGWSADRAWAAAARIERLLENEGPLARAEIGRRLAEAGFDAPGQALVHLLFMASLQGRIIRGPFRGAEQAFVLTRDWLGAPPRPLAAADRGRVLAELARRYLAGHGPAVAADLAVWAGLPLRDARAGLELAAASLHEHSDGRLDLRDRTAPARRTPPRLVPDFDAYLVGWDERTYAIPAGRAGQVRQGGMIRAVALVDGWAAGTWSARRRGRTVRVGVEEFEPLDADVRAGLEAEAADVVRFETGS